MNNKENDEFDKIIIKFIRNTYQISRIKQKMRFRRAIILEDGIHLLKDEPTTNAIKKKMAGIISKIFNYKREDAEKIIGKALNI